jgi:dihydrofolate synthase/folylpolyglutamate synthase
VVTAEGRDEAVKVLEAKCIEKNAELLRYGRDFSADLLSDDKEGILFRYSGSGSYPDLRLPLAGRHQMINAAMAVKTVEIIGQKYPGREFDIRQGLGRVKWPGRLEMLSHVPPILIDGAHNPAAAMTLSFHLKKLLSTEYRRIILVMGIMGDKDIDGIMEPLLPLSSGIIFSAPAYGRSAPPDLLASRARILGFSSDIAPDLRAAVDMARERCLPGDLIVVTGSFYTIGEVKEHLRGKGVLSRLRE